MKRKYTIEKFLQLDIDDKYFIIEDLLPEKYFSGQETIFKQEENHELTQQEEANFEKYVNDLAIEYFNQNKVLLYDLEKRIEETNIENEKFLNLGFKISENEVIIFNDKNKDLN
ncbi:hypothetical protein JSO54_09570 [Riemerella anatipestifer]|uniref:hypothetical protein n=1 Tax=Riemerella anatipestifer TaxID=34085 RepID=UPI0030BD933E